MKFSYYLLKKLVPELKTAREAVEKLTMHSFEVDDLGEGIFDVSISPNRFSDAASHFGLARELGAILKTKIKLPSVVAISGKNAKRSFSVSVEEPELCPRYSAVYFDLGSNGKSPTWIKKVLLDCGLRPINAVVDIMNYAMLETGQPLHAFDYDKLHGKNVPEIIVRRAKKREKLATLDNRDCDLGPDILIIADAENPLAIAGIKGGKAAEVDGKTKRIIVEAANFERVGIYASAKKLKIFTDASSRFSHDLSVELTELGIGRAAALLKELCGARSGQIVDVRNEKPKRTTVELDTERLKRFIGIDLPPKEIKDCLSALGFTILNRTKNGFLVGIPVLRPDVENFEDLAEEVIRLYGLNRLPAKAPNVVLTTSGYEDQITLRDKINKVLVAAGFSRVRNYSFADDKDLKITAAYGECGVEVENPISATYKYLRPGLAVHLLKNIESNLRFFDELRIFEIGKVFKKSANAIAEPTMLGLVIASKDKKKILFEMKGVLEALFGRTGLVRFSFEEAESEGSLSGWADHLRPETLLEITSDGKAIGFLGKVVEDWDGKEAVIAEINFDELLKQIVEENEFQPLPKYPSSARDVSAAVGPAVKIGRMIESIRKIDPSRIRDVDLIDEYEDKNLKGRRAITFRIVFQAEDRTLTDAEVNGLTEKITGILQNQFGAVIR